MIPEPLFNVEALAVVPIWKNYIPARDRPSCKNSWKNRLKTDSGMVFIEKYGIFPA
jgi:hypothetical protein